MYGQNHTGRINLYTDKTREREREREVKKYALIKLKRATKANLLLFASIESEPGNGEVSKVCPLASALSDLPQRSLWNIDAIGSRIGLHVSVNLSEDTSVKCKIS